MKSTHKVHKVNFPEEVNVSAWSDTEEAVTICAQFGISFNEGESGWALLEHFEKHLQLLGTLADGRALFHGAGHTVDHPRLAEFASDHGITFACDEYDWCDDSSDVGTGADNGCMVCPSWALNKGDVKVWMECEGGDRMFSFATSDAVVESACQGLLLGLKSLGPDADALDAEPHVENSVG